MQRYTTHQLELYMFAWQCTDPTGVDNLTWTELATPTPGADEVVIEIKAASLNFPDLLIVQNKYQFKPTPPFIPGAEFAGIVSACGSDVRHLAVGQAVAALPSVGAFGTHTCIKASLCIPLPDSFPLPAAAAFIMAYATSHHALIDRAQLQPGETVLILGAAGGVGSSAIQIAKAMGARVVAAASSAEKCAFCKALGADETIDYSTHTPDGGLRDAIKATCGPQGPNVIYDPVGGAFAEPAFRSIAWRGRYLVVGFASGDIPRVPFNLALLKGAAIVGVFWGDFAKREPKANAAMLGELLNWFAEGKINPPVQQTFAMTDLPAAFEVMAKRAINGKLVLTNP
jgi:NADPH:quinone reductase